jgi:hypothetical protein
LREGPRVGEKRRNSLVTARWVIAVDEVAEGVQGEVFRKRHPERQAAWLDCKAPAGAVEDDSEDRPVQRVDGEADRAPALPPRHRFPEHRDVRVVAAEQPPVERLE